MVVGAALRLMPSKRKWCIDELKHNTDLEKGDYSEGEMVESIREFGSGSIAVLVIFSSALAETDSKGT